MTHKKHDEEKHEEPKKETHKEEKHDKKQNTDERLERLEKQMEHLLSHMKRLSYAASVSYTPLEDKVD